MRLLKDRSAAVIVDVQEKLFPHIHEHDSMRDAQLILIEGLQHLGIPIRMTEQYKKGLGETLPSLREKLGMEGFEKIAFSCCDDETFAGELEELDRQIIILAGIETHVCVLQTAIDLLEKGYQPVVVADCVSSRKPGDKQVALRRMRQEGVVITTYESLLFELCRYAGNDTFKAISKLVK